MEFYEAGCSQIPLIKAFDYLIAVDNSDQADLVGSQQNKLSYTWVKQISAKNNL